MRPEETAGLQEPEEEREEILPPVGEDHAGPLADAETPPGAGEEAAALAEALRLALEREQVLQDRLLRLQADFDNYRKRTRREMEDLVRQASAGLVQNLLPVLDNLERALQSAPGDGAAILEGVGMVHRQLKEILANEGLQDIEAVGRPFDPERHHAVLRAEEETEYAVDTVVEELRRGYALHGRVLRPALVKVAPGTKQAAHAQETGSSSDEEERA